MEARGFAGARERKVPLKSPHAAPPRSAFQPQKSARFLRCLLNVPPCAAPLKSCLLWDPSSLPEASTLSLEPLGAVSVPLEGGLPQQERPQR